MLEPIFFLPPFLSGLDSQAVVTILVTLSMLGYLVLWELFPLMELLVQARDAMCAGDIDFVYTVGQFHSPLPCFMYGREASCD